MILLTQSEYNSLQKERSDLLGSSGHQGPSPNSFKIAKAEAIGHIMENATIVSESKIESTCFLPDDLATRLIKLGYYENQKFVANALVFLPYENSGVPKILRQSAIEWFIESKQIFGFVQPMADWSSWIYIIWGRETSYPFTKLWESYVPTDTFQKAQMACIEKMIELCENEASFSV